MHLVGCCYILYTMCSYLLWSVKGAWVESIYLLQNGNFISIIKRLSFDKVITLNMLQARFCIFILLVIVPLFSLQVYLIRALLFPVLLMNEYWLVKLVPKLFKRLFEFWVDYNASQCMLPFCSCSVKKDRVKDDLNHNNYLYYIERKLPLSALLGWIFLFKNTLNLQYNNTCNK
jgi:hypothetical protein